MSGMQSLRIIGPKGFRISAQKLAGSSLIWSRKSSIFAPTDTYARRHIGSLDENDTEHMLNTLGYASIDALVAAVVPKKILTRRPLRVKPAEGFTESELTKRLKEIAAKNAVLRSYIGTGYYGTIVPPVIQRNILECPEWYTSYTPYQPEISQGRLESLLNYQSLVTDLTGMSIANASLLDEGSAAAEAMLLSFHSTRGKKKTYYVDPSVHPQTLACIESRASVFGINIVGELPENDKDLFGAVAQYPATDGSVNDWSALSGRVHAAGGLFAVASDLLALTVLKPPSEFEADIVFGSSQRFGVPMGYGGPHAAFFAASDSHKRKLPGRLVGLSKDRLGDDAYRLALQTREQHIRREKATSNICTAQALLANMAAMYAVYHGPKGLEAIANRVYSIATVFAFELQKLGFNVVNQTWFDTITIRTLDADKVLAHAVAQYGINLRKVNETDVSVSMDETITKEDLVDLISVFSTLSNESPAAVITQDSVDELANKLGISSISAAPIPSQFKRGGKILNYKVFNNYHTETEMLRYIHYLQSKDLSLANSMIPLGSCTMKLNATTQMAPLSWPEFGSLHPFVPRDQANGYTELISELEADLADITGLDATSLQPNSGAQGEYTGLRVIRAYLDATGGSHRNVCLIPVSAHGTNPASAAMAGMKVVAIKCTAQGELDIADLQAKAEKHKDELAAIMMTYPSTFGVFEPRVRDAIDIVHNYGGQVYMDGANMNAQIGLCSPGDMGVDVCHLNLHKTFCIPHGGGGPGMGPICVKSHLEPFLPGHPVVTMAGDKSAAIQPVSAAPWGSASILTISWAYIKLMGGKGITKSTEYALLNANYMAERLKNHYPILYTNSQGRCAHEFIVDVRGMKETADIEPIDVAKRLQDYGFHAPTMSWPVAGTLMIEPTESESLAELDRFCDALISIRKEIRQIEDGEQPRENNVLKNSPHSLKDLLTGEWDRPYSREQAAFPLPHLKERKLWPTVTRLDDAYGDLNLFCTCEPPALEPEIHS
ncbi:glycine cleavage system P-protein-domain-containing protein [Lipomyces kononenkoae]|uniref:Glycine cleavage system P-protein-domain-containing protein n=1 Tax=Lipomyces kononenkoae TaxID=34357 RepID=A0ACC3SXX8_LIPKO